MDVLEHIDIEHLANTFRNFYELTHDLFIVSICTRPSSQNNKFHSTLLPRQTWIKLFELSGFSFIDKDYFKATNVYRDFSQLSDMDINQHWQKIDLFKDKTEGDVVYYIFQKKESILDWNIVEKKIRSFLDLDYRYTKRSETSLILNEKICFNLHLIQDWAIFRPFLDIFSNREIIFLIRPFLFTDLQLSVIIGFLQNKGIPYVMYKSVLELDWNYLKQFAFITGAESNATPGHMLSHQIVATARLQGCKTILLQHGITPSQGVRENIVMAFASEIVINYSHEEKNNLELGRHSFFNNDSPLGLFDTDQVRAIGSARYTDLLYPTTNDLLETRLGINREKFEQVVLFGTKNYSYWKCGEQFQLAIFKLIEENPSVLFLLKHHPCENNDSASFFTQSNVRILDDVCLITADLPLNRIIKHVDLVITPTSTLALDAAIAHKPVLIYQTERPLIYKQVQYKEFEEIENYIGPIKNWDELEKNSKNLYAIYADCVDYNFYNHFTKILHEPKTTTPLDKWLATVISTALDTESIISLNALNNDLSSQVDLSQKEIVRLKAKLNEYKSIKSIIKKVFRKLKVQTKRKLSL